MIYQKKIIPNTSNAFVMKKNIFLLYLYKKVVKLAHN